MRSVDGQADLVDHLERITRLTRPEIAKVLAEALDYFSEPVEAFVVRRHGELQAGGERNEAIFPRIAEELRGRRFAAPELSGRQLRRLVYG
jgi:hypothetical protein